MNWKVTKMNKLSDNKAEIKLTTIEIGDDTKALIELMKYLDKIIHYEITKAVMIFKK